MESPEEFVARQDTHFAGADRTHFSWQTGGAGFAEREASFLADLAADAGCPFLEIGCGEGANLFHLRHCARGVFVGFDRSEAKIRFARAAVDGPHFTCGDGGALPFDDGTFATVLIRDVLHHLASPRDTLREAARVLRPGGRFLLAEPNVHNPLIRLQMALVPAERGAARSDEVWLRALLEGLPLQDLHFSMAAPFPLDRVFLHPAYGFPSLGRRPTALRAIHAAEDLAGRLLGPSRWSYVLARAVRAQAPSAAGFGVDSGADG